MPQFEIAGLVIDVKSENHESTERMNEFSLNQYRDANLNISFKSNEFIDVPQGSIMDDKINIKWVKKPSGQSGYYFYTTEEDFGTILALADIDFDWKNAVLTCRDFTNKSAEESYSMQTWVYAHVMMGVIFRYNLIHYDGLVIHSSTLKHEGKGIMFSAPSGTGKSTHVKLWQKYIGEDVIVLNDDTPAVRIISEIPYVYGTPWSGSSFIHSNDSAPLEAIVLLEQDLENSIRRISNKEAILKLMPRVFLPYFDQDMMNKTMTVFEKVISKVPVYVLKCRPDEQAVELVYKCVR